MERSVASRAKLPEQGSFDEISEIPQLYSEIDEEDELKEDDTTEGFCEMNRSKVLHKALIRTCQSIWRQKNPNSSSEIDNHLAHVISSRCSFLLQVIFKRAHLNRRSALRILQTFPMNATKDLDNVPVNWEDVREASRQIIGQAALDQDTFLQFKKRLQSVFRKRN